MMSPELRERLDALTSVGWNVSRLTKPVPLPETIVDRYAWVSRDVLDFVSEIEEAGNAKNVSDQKAWFLSPGDFAGTSGKAFAWNEWELLGLDAAEDDDEWKGEVTAFWDQHFPILTSLKSGYAYFAIERENNGIVVGEEPEFEAVTPVAASVSDLLQMIAARSKVLEPWL
jgi:hypothetical protein